MKTKKIKKIKHRVLVFFWKCPYFIMNILYPGWPLSPVMARQHTCLLLSILTTLTGVTDHATVL